MAGPRRSVRHVPALAVDGPGRSREIGLPRSRPPVPLRSLALLAAVVAALVALAVLSVRAPARASAPGDDVFSGMQVHEIRLRFEQPAYRDSLRLHYAVDDGQYIAAAATLDGVAMDSVGVRFKGNSSYDHPNDKRPLRLGFGAFREGQRWDGLKSVHLNNGFGDPSFLRERLYSDVCRDVGLPAPRASYAVVTINDVPYGLYTLVEHVDKTFLAARFGNADGALVKAVDAFGPNTPVSDFRRLGDDASAYRRHYDLKSDSTAAWPALLAVIEAVNTPGAALDSLVHLDAFYRAMAVDHLLGNLDSYSVSGRNFYLYFDTATGRMEWIPWDVGLSVGGYPVRGTTPETLPLTFAKGTRPLATAVFDAPATRAAYLATARAVAARIAPERLFPHIDSLVVLIRPYVAADPRRQYTMAEFEANIDRDVDGGSYDGRGGRKPGIKSFLTARAASLRSQLAGQP